MKSLLVGVLILAATVFAAFSYDIFGWGPRWWGYVLIFLRGGVPVVAALIGLVAVFIGIADMRDRAAAKKESLTEDEPAEKAGE